MMPIRKMNEQNWLPSVFNDFFDNEWMAKANATAPSINVVEEKDGYKVEVAAPGMTKEDFHIHIGDENELVINMEKKTQNQEENKERKYLRREFAYSKFEQSLILPDNVEKERISASVTDGVLTIDLPKMKPEEKRQSQRVIEIQ